MVHAVDRTADDDDDRWWWSRLMMMDVDDRCWWRSLLMMTMADVDDECRWWCRLISNSMTKATLLRLNFFFINDHSNFRRPKMNSPQSYSALTPTSDLSPTAAHTDYRSHTCWLIPSLSLYTAGAAVWRSYIYLGVTGAGTKVVPNLTSIRNPVTPSGWGSPEPEQNLFQIWRGSEIRWLPRRGSAKTLNYLVAKSLKSEIWG